MLDLIVPYLKRRVKGKAQRSVEGLRGQPHELQSLGPGTGITEALFGVKVKALSLILVAMGGFSRDGRRYAAKTSYIGA